MNGMNMKREEAVSGFTFPELVLIVSGDTEIEVNDGVVISRNVTGLLGEVSFLNGERACAPAQHSATLEFSDSTYLASGRRQRLCHRWCWCWCWCWARPPWLTEGWILLHE